MPPPQISPINRRIDFLEGFPVPRTILLICVPKGIFYRLLESKIPIPTARRLRYAETTKIVWAPSYRHARAFLSTIEPSTEKGGFLAIWGLTNAQYCTVEWSAQGVARTLVHAIDAADRSGRTLSLAGTPGWIDRKMPLLNANIDTTGITHLLENKTVTVKRILMRWISFPEDDKKEEEAVADGSAHAKRKRKAAVAFGNKDSKLKRIRF
ncbi:Similar to hypothetical protein MGYG_03256 [Arthroderma gypseum CBS 118893]; acc. no. XP_003175735 [Pyronema omphalodes CBS 100304]|uniref:Uncharacterized protein n=1 Tax=Pyronema omphalodes (strain CBS 100304) TaxID=1076935 RepID=U4LJC9_PYROM|nr:Similar to hypothetical protein MGYG_03256 [Arthroderma gypseum CBS 118893]; acc. no. XP_003175735 [Pyronema omphalodes CBS 100304]